MVAFAKGVAETIERMDNQKCSCPQCQASGKAGKPITSVVPLGKSAVKPAKLRSDLQRFFDSGAYWIIVFTHDDDVTQQFIEDVKKVLMASANPTNKPTDQMVLFVGPGFFDEDVDQLVAVVPRTAENAAGLAALMNETCRDGDGDSKVMAAKLLAGRVLVMGDPPEKGTFEDLRLAFSKFIDREGSSLKPL